MLQAGFQVSVSQKEQSQIITGFNQIGFDFQTLDKFLLRLLWPTGGVVHQSQLVPCHTVIGSDIKHLAELLLGGWKIAKHPLELPQVVTGLTRFRLVGDDFPVQILRFFRVGGLKCDTAQVEQCTGALRIDLECPAVQFGGPFVVTYRQVYVPQVYQHMEIARFLLQYLGVVTPSLQRLVL